MDVRVNAAMSADGKLASYRREPVVISGPEDFARVERLRADVDGVLVGVETVLADDPSLTVEEIEPDNGTRSAQPARIVVDSTGRTPLDATILDSQARTIMLLTQTASNDRVAAYDAAGVSVIKAGKDRVDLVAAFEQLEKAGIHQLLVEGGGEVIFSLFEAGLVDQLSVYIGPLIIGGRDAPTLADGSGFIDHFPGLTLASVEHLDAGLLVHWDVDDTENE